MSHHPQSPATPQPSSAVQQSDSTAQLQEEARPNMMRAPLAFTTVLGVAMGGAIVMAEAGLGRVFGGKAGGSFTERLMSKDAVVATAIGGTAGGLAGYVSAKSRNITLDHVEPYVDRLEQQRDEAKQNAQKTLNALG